MLLDALGEIGPAAGECDWGVEEERMRRRDHRVVEISPHQRDLVTKPERRNAVPRQAWQRSRSREIDNAQNSPMARVTFRHALHLHCTILAFRHRFFG